MNALADILAAHPISAASVSPQSGPWDCHACKAAHRSWGEYVAHVIEAVTAAGLKVS